MEIESRECPVCKQEFPLTRKDRTYCSNKCALRACNRGVRIRGDMTSVKCVICGSEMLANKNTKTPICSYACKYKYRKQSGYYERSKLKKLNNG